MRGIEATLPDGRIAKATGTSEADALRRLRSFIQQETGAIVVGATEERSGWLELLQPSPEFFAEPPGGLGFERVTFRITDGRICTCNSSKCVCRPATSNFSERGNTMKTRRASRHDDTNNGGDLDDLREQVHGAAALCEDAERLQSALDILQGEDMDDEDLAGEQFDDTDPKNGLERSAMDNLPGGKGASIDKNRERRVNVGKFSESQRDDLGEAIRYYNRHGAELRRAGLDPQASINDARDLIAAGHRWANIEKGR